MPHIYSSGEYTKATGKKLDIRNPRQWTQTIAQEPALDAKTKGQLLRAEAAQQNGFENLGFFAAAVVAGNMGHLSPSVLNGLSIGYVVSRFVFNHVYMFNETEFLAKCRSVSYIAGVGMCCALYVMGGRALNSSLLSV